MKKLIITLISLITLGDIQLFSQTLLFKSGFESNVQLNPPVAGGNPSQWLQSMSGQDQGFDWALNLPAYGIGTWRYLVSGDSLLNDYVNVKIDTTTGPNNNSSNALFMQIKKYSSNGFGSFAKVRTQYDLDWDSTISTQAYSKYWMKFQPDLAHVMVPGTNTWRYMMEWRETGTANDDYRWTLGLLTGNNPADSIYWKLDGQFISGTNTFTNDWVQINQSTPVPIGQWFQLEVYWNQKADSTGRIWVAIDGVTIFNYIGPNRLNSAIRTWSIFKNYTGAESIDSGLVYQWLDDVEIWDSIPANVTGIHEQSSGGLYTIKVYPNPANNEIKVVWDSKANTQVSTISITNLMGQWVYSKTISGNQEGQITVNTSNFPDGIYFIELTGSKEKSVKKIIVQH